jgi:hypothetical protein
MIEDKPLQIRAGENDPSQLIGSLLLGLVGSAVYSERFNVRRPGEQQRIANERFRGAFVIYSRRLSVNETLESCEDTRMPRHPATLVMGPAD